MRLIALPVSFMLVLCTSCDTVETNRALNAEVRALPSHSLVQFGTPADAHDGGSTSIALTFTNGQTYMLRCFCVGNLMIGRWKTNLWEKGYRFQLYRPGQDERAETIRLDSPIACHLSILLGEFAEDSADKRLGAYATSLSSMMYRSTYETGKASSTFMLY
jgi:hypothetical protein